LAVGWLGIGDPFPALPVSVVQSITVIDSNSHPCDTAEQDQRPYQYEFRTALIELTEAA
jgi:hypothetical protein